MPRNTRVSWLTDFGSITLDTHTWAFVATVHGAAHLRGYVRHRDRVSMNRARRAIEVDVQGRLLWGEAISYAA